MKSFWKRFSKNRGAVVGLGILMAFLAVACFASFIAPYSPQKVFTDAYKVPPLWMNGGNFRFLLGTDDIGRDFLTRLIYGSRVSLGVGFVVVVLASFFGTALGLMAGFFSGWFDRVVMRFVDILMALPSILLALVIVAVLGPSLVNGVLAVSIVALPNFIRIVRAAVLAEKKKTYVDASIGFGASSWRQIMIHILPNCVAPIIVQSSLGFSEGILSVAALGFLGMGAQAPTPEWGVMLSDARAYIESASWLVTFPGICILVVVLSFNLLGDGLRDALDPKLRGR